MKYAIVYSSQTGNTKMLAEKVKNILPDGECIYFGSPDIAALEAERIYLGFWTDRGSCDGQTADFLKKLTSQELFLFGTAGFGENQEYFDTVVEHSCKNMPKGVKLIGSFMCQGKMPMEVRHRYEKMQAGAVIAPNVQGMIDNFDKALSHPDACDLDALCLAVRQHMPI
ncbi:MAG: flavodoxin family protein BilS [Candidatus Limivicinus sp.]